MFSSVFWALKKSLRIIRHLLDCKGQLFTTPMVYKLIFFAITLLLQRICQLSGLVLLKTELLWHSSNGFLAIIQDHVGWSLTRNRTKEYIKFLALKVPVTIYVRNLGSGCLGESFWNNIWVRKKTVSGRESIYLKYSLTRWWLTRSGRCESWLCCLASILNSWIIMLY